MLGSIVGTRIDLQEVFELHTAGKTEVVYQRRQLEDANTAIHEVETGQVKARIMFRPPLADGCPCERGRKAPVKAGPNAVRSRRDRTRSGQDRIEGGASGTFVPVRYSRRPPIL